MPWPRRVAALVVSTLVLAVHGCVAEQMAERMADVDAEAAMPQRVEVAYVRELEVSAPPPIAPAPAAPKPVRSKRAAAPKPAASAASAAEEPAVDPLVVAAQEADLTAPVMPEPAEFPQPTVPEEEPAPSVPEPAAPAVAEAASAPPFEWPASTRLSYVLTGNYQGEIHGYAQVEWVRIGMRYQVHLDVTVGLPVMPLMTRKMTSDGLLTPEGLYPERYDEYSKVGFRDPRRATIRFEPDRIVMPDGRRRERWPGVQDAASQFVQLTYLFTTQPELLTTGRVIDVPLALPRNVDRWVYDVLESETLYTPFGAVDAMHLKPRRVARKGSDLTAEIWFAPTLAYLPVRIRIRQDESTFIDLIIRRKPELAAR
ncbi:MAG TPA: DUF3108 domain-containing protein [Albitalea sp.]